MLELELQQLSFGNGDNSAKQMQIEEELKMQRSRQEDIFRQKSRELWLEKKGPKQYIFSLKPYFLKKKK